MTELEKEIFIQTFNNNAGTCRLGCDCGKIYYDESFNDWEPGELPTLKAKGIPLDHGIGILEFEGSAYADVCDCWHPRAEIIIRFIKSHKYMIASFLNKLKKAEKEILDSVPDVEFGKETEG